MANILEPTEKELRFQKELRDEAIKEMHREYDYVNHRKFDIGHLAERLGVSTSGVESLMAKDIWPIETGMRVCEALDLDVSLSVGQYRY